MKWIALFVMMSSVLTAKNHHSSSSSDCDKKVLKLLHKIDRTTEGDFSLDRESLNLISRIVQTVDRIDDNTSCGQPIHLTQSMVSSQGLIIDQPGVYAFCESIQFLPNVPATSRTTKQEAVDVAKLEKTVRALFHAGRKTTPTRHEIMHAVKKKMSHKASSFAVQGRPAAITIAASNVVLDLNNFSLVQGNSTQDVVGIELLPGVTNVTIANGTITGFLGAAIHSFVDTANPDDIWTVDGVRFENLNLVANGGHGDETQGTALATGISFETNDSFESFLEHPGFENVVVSNCRVNNNTLGGMYFIATRNLVIENSECNGTFVDSSSPSGFIFAIAGLTMYGVDNVKIVQSTFNSTNQLDRSKFIFGLTGLFMDFVHNMAVDSSTFNGTTGNAIFVQSAVGTNSAGIICTNCQFNSAHGFANTGNVGFHISDDPGTQVPSEGYKMYNCQFNDNIMEVTDTSFDFIVVHGVDWLTFRGVVFDGCQSIGHKYVLVGDYPSYDYAWIVHGMSVVCASGDPVSSDIASLRTVRWKNCTIADISGLGTATGIQFGAFGAAEDSYLQSAFAASIEDCNISRIHTEDDASGLAGIALVASPSTGEGRALCQDAQIKNTRIVDVRRTVEGNSDTAGILVQGVDRPVIADNSVGNCINGIILMDTTRGIISRNEVSNCDFIGFGDLFETTSSLWLNNVAFANGPTATYDYAIQWPGSAPVSYGTLSSYPTGMQNISVRP